MKLDAGFDELVFFDDPPYYDDYLDPLPPPKPKEPPLPKLEADKIVSVKPMAGVERLFDSNPYADHKCQEMVAENQRRKRQYGGDRKWIIKFKKDKWVLQAANADDMPVVQCPFCHKRMWSGNQVEIE